MTRTTAHILRRFLQAKSVPWVNLILSAWWPSRDLLTTDLKKSAQIEDTESLCKNYVLQTFYSECSTPNPIYTVLIH